MEVYIREWTALCRENLIFCKNQEKIKYFISNQTISHNIDLESLWVGILFSQDSFFIQSLSILLFFEATIFLYIFFLGLLGHFDCILYFVNIKKFH